MSHQAVTFVKQNSRQKGGAYLCLLIIAEHAYADGTGSHPGIGLLAEECRLDERHVRRLIDKLESSKELFVERGRGRGNSHQFTVVMTPIKPDILSSISPVKPDILPGIDAVKPDILGDKTGHLEQLKPDISAIKPDIFDNCNIGYARVGEPSYNRPKKPRERECVRATGNVLPNTTAHSPKSSAKKPEPVYLSPPTPEAVEVFCEWNGWPGLGQAALDFQSQRGWQMKSGPVMDWQAAVRTWKRNKDRYEEQDRQEALARSARAGPPTRAAPVTSPADQARQMTDQIERMRGR